VTACICWLNVPFQERARMDRNVEIDPNCPVHGKPHGHEHTLGLAAKVRIDQLTRQVEEERRRHEAEIRAKDEELLELYRPARSWTCSNCMEGA
jgi:DNA repair exonuclease SbcCD ATPase subunit